MTHSEAEFISLLQRGKRPIADISFKNRTEQNSYVNSIRIGRLFITEIKTDAFISKPLIEPHLSFAIQVAGNGKVSEKGKVNQWEATQKIHSVSYAWPMLIDFDGFHGVFFRPSIDDVARVLAGRHPSLPNATEAWRESCVTTYAGSYGGVQYYTQLESLLSIVRQANGDEDFLSRIGLDSVFNGILAELIVAHSRHDPDEREPAHLPRSARAVDLICDHIMQNIGQPLTIVKMEELAGLTGRALNYAFQQRFGCSPQEWQRGFLLDEARRRLSAGDALSSIKNVSYVLGFSSPSSFAAHYKRKFGELPSQTASRSALPTLRDSANDAK